jgi:MFS family permease
MLNFANSLARRFPALGSRDFAIFWVGHLISLIGSSMQNTAQPLLAYRISGRPFDLGLIAFALTLPTFFLAIPGGVLIEHMDKRRVIIAMQAVMMLDTFVLAILALGGDIQIWHIVLLSLILGVATAFEITARQAMLIELVGRDLLPNAIALQSTAFNLSRVLGPALVAPALLFFTVNGEGWVFLFNGFSFAAILISLFFVHPKFAEPRQPRSLPMLEEFREGMRYLAANSHVSLLIVIAAMLGFFAFPIIQQLPVVSKDLLKQAADTKAIVDLRNSMIYTAQGTGALVAAFMIAFNNTARLRGLRLLLGEGLFIFGMIAIPFSLSLWPAMIVIALMGWGAVTQLATMNTLIQLQVPNALRGRVFSIYLWALQGIAPFGSLFVGWMTEEFGLPSTTILCGIICLLVIGSIQLFQPKIRNSEG